MSKRENEEGTLKLPTAAWSKFKKTLQNGMAVQLTAEFELALKIHAVLVEQKKGKRGFDLKAAFDAEFYAEESSPSRSSWSMSAREKVRKYPFELLDAWQVRSAILGADAPFSLRKPQKKLFPTPTSATLSFTDKSCSLTLDNETRELHWHVESGNRNVEEAHASVLGQLMFSALEKVTWTRDTGGTFVGNDEYHEEAGEGREGGGGNYVTRRFGPRGEFKIPVYALPRRRSPAKTAKAAPRKRG